MKRLGLIIALCLAYVTAAAQTPQRHITPVKVEEKTTVINPIDEKKKKEKDKYARPASVVERTDAAGRTYLIDTISGSEWVDSLAILQMQEIGNIYPLLTDVAVGVDFWEPLMRVLGSHNGASSAWVELSLHNRYKPYFEFGMSTSSDAPSGSNFTYSAPLRPFFKLGMNYNFMYNSISDYQFYAGVRYGITFFNYRYTDVTVENSYWGLTGHPDFPTTNSTTGFLEFAIGVKVKLVGPLSAGWSLKYHRIIHKSAEPYGAALYVPGYGKHNSSLGVSLSLIYTLPLSKFDTSKLTTIKKKKKTSSSSSSSSSNSNNTIR
jgi:hypothetical protein